MNKALSLLHLIIVSTIFFPIKAFALSENDIYGLYYLSFIADTTKETARYNALRGCDDLHGTTIFYDNGRIGETHFNKISKKQVFTQSKERYKIENGLIYIGNSETPLALNQDGDLEFYIKDQNGKNIKSILVRCDRQTSIDVMRHLGMDYLFPKM